MIPQDGLISTPSPVCSGAKLGLLTCEKEMELPSSDVPKQFFPVFNLCEDVEKVFGRVHRPEEGEVEVERR